MSKNTNKPTAKTAHDGLLNVVSGLGSAKAKSEAGEFVFSEYDSHVELRAAYRDEWLARQIIDVPADDMTREWRTIKSDGADKIKAEENRVSLQQTCKKALMWSRLFGGAGVLMITNQDLSKPLDVSKIKKGGLERLLILDRYNMHPQAINNWEPLAENFNLPESYTVRGGSQTIHWSHFAIFKGSDLPMDDAIQNHGWSDSELRKCMTDLKKLIGARDGIAELMQEANVDVLTVEGLNDALASDQDKSIVKKYELLSMMKSVVHTMLLDKEEVYDRKTLQLGGVAPILEIFMTWISGAADIPVTRLFGTSAKGMNATGEGDLSNYYDSIRSKQYSQLSMPLRHLDEVLVRSALGNMPDDYAYEWNVLKQPNQVEEAQAKLLRQQKDQGYMDMGTVTKTQVMRNLQANEEYQYDEDELAAMESAESEGDDFGYQETETPTNSFYGDK